MTSSALCACGGFLGLTGDDDDDPPISSSVDGGGDTFSATGSNDPRADAASLDADLGDVVIVVPPLDASVDSSKPGDKLFPRLATFEGGNLVAADGADVNNGMSLLDSFAPKGTYAAQSKNPSTSIGFNFASAPTDEIYVLFLFRIEQMPAAGNPAAFFGLALAGGGNIGAAIKSDGQVFVVGGGTPTKIDTVAAGGGRLFGIHARKSPALLEAAIVPDGPFDGAKPVIVPWAAPDSVVGSALGELSNSAMRVTVDQIGFSQSGFGK